MTDPILITGLTFALIGALTLLFFRNLAVGLAVLIVALPFERIGAYPLNPATGYPLIHPAQIVGAALIAAYLAHIVFKGLRPIKLKSLPWLLAFLASATISAAIVRVAQVWQILVWLCFITMLFWVVANITATVKTGFIKRVIAITVIIVSVFGIYQFFGDLAGLPNNYTGIRDRYSADRLGFPRLQSTALEPLYFANYLFLPLLVLLATQIQGGKKDRLAWVALGTGLVAFALTYSRGAMAAGLVGLLVLVVLMRKQFGGWAKANLVPLIIVIAALAIGAGFLMSASISKSESDRTGIKNAGDFFIGRVFVTGSYTERLRDQKLAIQIYKDNPVFGVGIGGFGSAYYGCVAGKCVYRPNNQALEVLAEGGIVGFVTFHLFLLSVLYYGYRSLKRLSGQHRAMVVGLMAATVAMIVQSQTFSGFLCCLTYTWVTLALLAGLSAHGKEVAATATTSKPS